MPSDSPVSVWIERLKSGDEEAANHLWRRYFDQLVRLVRAKLRVTPTRATDEDDVALSAFKSLCLGATRGRFPELTSRDQLWRLLVVITARKAWAHVEHERRFKRGGGKVFSQSILTGLCNEDSGLAQIVGKKPTPEFAAQVAEEYAILLDRLGDATLRQVAQWKLEGYTNEEIAGKLGCVPRTVERKLERIRSKWHRESVR